MSNKLTGRRYVTLFRNGFIFENYYVEFEELSRKNKGDEVRLFRKIGMDEISPGSFEVAFSCKISPESSWYKYFVTKTGFLIVNVLEDRSAYGTILSIYEENIGVGRPP